MSAWHSVLQDASFKDVRFDVVSIDESNSKALVEHARPFVQGTELEDMGSTGRQIQISAVFWGKGYSSRLVKLLNALEEPGGGVLVHPIWGRMQNMVPSSWSYRHEADNIDHATIDITFRESGEPQNLFVFENNFLMEIEKLIAKIESYRDVALDYIDAILAIDAGVSSLWGSALGIWSAGMGVFSAIRQLFDFNEVGWPWRGAYTASTFRVDAVKNINVMSQMIAQGLSNSVNIYSVVDVFQGGLSARAKFDELINKANECNALPKRLLMGVSHSSALSLANKSSQDNFENNTNQLLQLSTLQKITPNQMKPIDLVVRIAVCVAVATIVVELIEEHGEDMSAPDLMHVNRVMRQHIQAQIDILRGVQNQNKETLYSPTYEACEALRNVANGINKLIIAAINQKPPLIVRAAPMDGTLHQIAFAFYGDIDRTDELIKLNPHITHPAFITKGLLINGYAK